jgi:hypothetical protein
MLGDEVRFGVSNLNGQALLLSEKRLLEVCAA